MTRSDAGFATALLDRKADLWDRMLHHPFLIRARDGELDEGIFETWLRQDYLFVEAAIPFVGSLIAKAPSADIRSELAAIPTMLEEELELFEERADHLGVSVEDLEPGLTNHAYVQFLLATGARESFPAAFAVYWAAEKAYHESWKVVESGIGSDHPWQPFVRNWAGQDFEQLVEFLEGRIDRMAAEAGEATRRRMEDLVETTIRYEIAFWEMALNGPEWPGVRPTDS